MKSFLILTLLACALPLAGQEPLTSTPPKIAADDAIAPVLNEHDQRVQQFMAERAKLIEARQAVKEKAKKAQEKKDTKSLKAAQDEKAQLERDFAVRNADLVRQIKAGEDAKKTLPPGDALK